MGRHLVCDDYGMGGLWWFEVNPSGQTIRAVRERPSDGSVRIVPTGMNPMSDLYDPMYDDREIAEADFEDVWARARDLDGHVD